MNKTVKTLAAMAGVVALLVVVRFGLLATRTQDDQALIRAALKESIEASREGRPGGVLDKLSDRFRINDAEPGTRSQIARFIKDSKPDVTVENQNAIITGDEARIVSPVTVKVSFLGSNLNRTIQDVSITFRKEDSMRYLIFPTRTWKLAEVNAPEASISDFLQG